MRKFVNESLERRLLLATVTVTGSGGNDAIDLQKSGTSLIVRNNSLTQTIIVNGSNLAPQTPRTVLDATAVTLDGSAGNDVIQCNTNINIVVTIAGGTGNDTIIGGQLGDQLAGGDGNDFVRGFSGNDNISGETSAFLGADTLFGDLGNDTITGGPGGDAIYGDDNNANLNDDGNDSLSGGNDLDYLTGNGGRDTMNGDGGNDFFTNLDRNADTINGGTGTDRCAEEDNSDPIPDDLLTAIEVMSGFIGSQGIEGDFIVVELSSSADTLTLDGDGNDLLFIIINGFSFTESLAALAINGNNNGGLRGYQIEADDGNDLITLGDNIPRSLDGNSLTLRVRGDLGADTIQGGAGPEVLSGDTGNDSIRGGGGDDFIEGCGGADLLFGDGGDDLLFGEGDNFTFDPAYVVGADTFNGGDGIDTVSYNDRNDDFAFVHAAGVLITLGAGTPADGLPGENDQIQPDVEAAAGSPGPDQLVGTAGDNGLNGSDGDDSISAGAGNDLLIDDDADLFDSEDGDDTMDGGAGDDVFQLTGNADSDLLIGAAGNDTADYSSGFSVKLSIDGLTNDGGFGETDNIGTEIETLIGSGGDDTLSGSAADNLLIGGDGNDSLLGFAGDDELRGGAGADTLLPSTGVDFADYSERTFAVNLSLDGIANDGVAGEGDNLSADFEILAGGSGADSLVGGAGNETLLGNGGADTLRGAGGNDFADGGSGADLLSADAGVDALNGGPGSDIILVSGAGTRGEFVISQDLQSLTIQQGAIAALPAAPNSFVRTRGLSILAGRLDLRSGALIFDYETITPLPTLAANVVLAYAANVWNGIGIGSSIAAATPGATDAVGISEAIAAFGSFPASFFGQSIDNTTVIARYTRSGDANLDGQTNVADFSRLAANFNTAGLEAWSRGDFNFDGQINLGDFSLLVANFNQAV